VAGTAGAGTTNERSADVPAAVAFVAFGLVRGVDGRPREAAEDGEEARGEERVVVVVARRNSLLSLETAVRDDTTNERASSALYRVAFEAALLEMSDGGGCVVG
jgi:hypothetical protein